MLDNVTTAAQLAPLIPAGGGCAVLAVGRRRLTSLPEAVACPLGPLPDGEALDLLSRLAGSARLDTERDDALRLVRLCSGLPLAIRVVGARLAARPDLPVAHLADRLADEQRRLDELEVGDVQVRACLAVSFQRLPAEARRALRLVALLPGPQVPGPLIAAVLGVAEAGADRVVARLLDEHLLEVAGPHRYRLHDLVRLFAAERAAAEEPGEQRAAAIRRAYRTLLALARAADDRMPARRYPCPVPAGPPAAVPPAVPAEVPGWLDAERGTLLAFVAAARRLGVPEPAETVPDLVSGRLDTVLAGCVDNLNSPHSEAGSPCTASFLLCLSCPCARATPVHLPVQVLVHDELLARRTRMTPLAWAQRFAAPATQLADLLAQYGPGAVADARANATDSQRELVDRFLSRELDWT